MQNVRKMQMVGLVALATTVMLWATFALATRSVGQSSLTVVDATMLRFATPLVLLSPWIPQTIRALRRERATAIVMVCLGGAPQFVLCVLGARATSAALMGLIVPGTVPLFVALILLAFQRQPIRPFQRGALLILASGVFVGALSIGSESAFAGSLVLVLAGLLWSVYTVGLKRVQLTVIQVIVTVSATSTAGAMVLAVMRLAPSHLASLTTSWGEVLQYVALFGLGTGIVSTLSYVFAVKQLGSTLPAFAGAFSPVLTAMLAFFILGESVSIALAIGLTLMSAGIILFNLPARAHRSTRPDIQRTQHGLVLRRRMRLTQGSS